MTSESKIKEKEECDREKQECKYIKWKKDNEIKTFCSDAISFIAYVEITLIIGAAQTSQLQNVPSHRAQWETRGSHQNYVPYFR